MSWSLGSTAKRLSRLVTMIPALLRVVRRVRVRIELLRMVVGWMRLRGIGILIFILAAIGNHLVRWHAVHHGELWRVAVTAAWVSRQTPLVRQLGVLLCRSDSGHLHRRACEDTGEMPSGRDRAEVDAP